MSNSRDWVLPEELFRGNFGAKRSEEHTSELQSRSDLVCRLLLEKKKKNIVQLSRTKANMYQHQSRCDHGDQVMYEKTQEQLEATDECSLGNNTETIRFTRLGRQ